MFFEECFLIYGNRAYDILNWYKQEMEAVEGDRKYEDQNNSKYEIMFSAQYWTQMETIMNKILIRFVWNYSRVLSNPPY